MTQAETGGGGTSRWLRAWIAVCILGGLVLRIIGARGDLWQDEIWTFSLLGTVSSPLGIFLDMSADNNHFLNTLYLYFVGPDATPLAQRAFAILLGTVMIAAVAFLLRRAHWSAIAFGTALFAFGYPLVHYGSEARGYAGFLLCMVISIGLVERELRQSSPRTRLWLGLSNLAGTLFQPIMVGTIAVLMAWSLWHPWRHGETLRQAARTTQHIFSITVRLLLVVLLLAVIAVYRVGGYKILATEQFDWESVIRGYGGMLSCRYDAAAKTVGARPLVVDGTAPHGVVTVTVTAYADENTSDPVGSETQTWRGSRAHHRRVVITIPVTRPPHVDEDGEGACRLDVED